MSRTYSTLSTARRFSRDEGGNFAVMAAITSVLLVGVAGLAIDSIRGFAAKQELATASDAVALMIAKSGENAQADMRTIADAYLAEYYPGETGARLSVVSIDRVGDEVTVQLANNIDTTMGRMLNTSDLDIGAGSSAIYSQKRMDIALVLDTTKSMGEGGKLANLKRAAGDMVTTIDGFDSDNVRMSVVPFSNYVKVGTSRRGARWLDVPADRTNARGPRCWDQQDVISRSGPYSVQVQRNVDGRIVTSTQTRYRNVVRGPKYQKCDAGATWTQTWQGCVGSRSEPRDQQVGFRGRKIPGVYQDCGAQLQELSGDLSQVKATINSLAPQGDTYMPAGLMWGWRTLDGGAPLTSTAADGTEKVLVLMTDGTNSVRKVGIEHADSGGTDAARMDAVNRQANAKTRAICNAVKAQDITVYTIAYDVSDAKTRTLLEGCATSRGNYFDARNASDLDDAFREIGASLNQLRITA